MASEVKFEIVEMNFRTSCEEPTLSMRIFFHILINLLGTREPQRSLGRLLCSQSRPRVRFLPMQQEPSARNSHSFQVATSSQAATPSPQGSSGQWIRPPSRRRLQDSHRARPRCVERRARATAIARTLACVRASVAGVATTARSRGARSVAQDTAGAHWVTPRVLACATLATRATTVLSTCRRPCLHPRRRSRQSFLSLCRSPQCISM